MIWFLKLTWLSDLTANSAVSQIKNAREELLSLREKVVPSFKKDFPL